MEKLNLDNEIHPLILGKSFDKKSSTAFHSIRYDFKPASVDTSQVSSVEVGENSSVTVEVPHVEGSGTSHTAYKGNKRPSHKECVLIIDHTTGEFRLEKLANTIQLKKTRLEGRPKLRPVTPVDHPPPPKPRDIVKQSPVKKSPLPPASHQSHNPTPQHAPPPPPIAPQPSVHPTSHDAGSPDVSSDSSSGSSDSSDSEDDENHKPEQKVQQLERSDSTEAQRAPPFHSTLSEDLRLSESGSDSD